MRLVKNIVAIAMLLAGATLLAAQPGFSQSATLPKCRATATPSTPALVAENSIVTQNCDLHGNLRVTQSGGSTFAPSVVALSTTAVQVLAAGAFATRIVCNDDAAIVQYVGPAGVTSAGVGGEKVGPGTCWDASKTTAALYMVAASGTPNARVVQY